MPQTVHPASGVRRLIFLLATVPACTVADPHYLIGHRRLLQFHILLTRSILVHTLHRPGQPAHANLSY
jgi:hypothetical protein